MSAVAMVSPASFATPREDRVYQALAEHGIGPDQVSELNIISNEGSDGRARHVYGGSGSCGSRPGGPAAGGSADPAGAPGVPRAARPGVR